VIRNVIYRVHSGGNQNGGHIERFLGTFRRVRKISKKLLLASLRLYVYPSCRMEQLGSDWMDFHEIWYLDIFRNSCHENSSFVKITRE